MLKRQTMQSGRCPPPFFVTVALALSLTSIGGLSWAGDDDDFRIEKAVWRAEKLVLIVRGEGRDKHNVTIFNAASSEQLGQDQIDDHHWRIRLKNPATVACRIRAEQSDGQVHEKKVKDAPENCDDGSGPPVISGDLQVLAANDLGMHCADLDYQIFSILPPFNVVHAQVIEKGVRPRILDNSEINVYYSASSSPNDPAGSGSINTTSRNLNGVFKSNFWRQTDALSTLGGQSYGPLYPGVQVIDDLGGPNLSDLCDDPTTPSGCPSALSLFEPLPDETGLPVPHIDALYPASPINPPLLLTSQQNMPGPMNEAQLFERFDSEVPFFVQFPFGSRLAERNWFAADGIPILPVDDFGRPNSYPLVKVSVQAKNGGPDLSSLDIVTPVASEADCQNCHVDPFDCLGAVDADPSIGIDPARCTGAAIESLLSADLLAVFEADSPGDTALEKLLNTAKINILRLHDLKHGSVYGNWDSNHQLTAQPCGIDADLNDPSCLSNQTPIQCSRCHYSPALDLAQAGPVNEPEQSEQGRQQTYHITMSRAMHGHHGSLEDELGQPIFPAMPAPSERQALSDAQIEGIMNDTCYQCHPGKRTQCLRGAMFSGGVLCQDCHGDMQQVGNDFSVRVATHNPGDFVLDGSLRVPWASEPACQSCHTGDALDTNHPPSAQVADDGIRLLQAYFSEIIDVPGLPAPIKVANIIRAPDSRFAENQTRNSHGDTVDVLYRLSKGHGGVMCEGCHNSTHAIWPNQNPFANDNVASMQLQGHRGTLIECDTCHTGTLRPSLDGPHSMHPLNTTWVNEHEDLAEDNLTACQSCHGQTLQGTVLSRMAQTRTFNNVDDVGTITLNRGQAVACDLCHENPLDDD